MGLMFLQPEYPRLHEAVDAGVAPVSIDLNTFIDTALDKIYRFGGNRTIILSSFTPEVCILLAIKQQTYPVMFITNAGKPPETDREMRAGSLCKALEPVWRCLCVRAADSVSETGPVREKVRIELRLLRPLEQYSGEC